MASSTCSKFVIKIVLIWNFVEGIQQDVTKKRGQVGGRGVFQFDKLITLYRPDLT